MNEYLNKKVYVAGHSGLVGSSIMRYLKVKGYTNLLTKELDELDLIKQKDVEDFFSLEKPDVVIVAAARVGGILANNTYRAEFIYQNLMIEANVIHAAYKCGVKKLILLGSSSIYPKETLQPMKEEYLLTGALEPTNEPYAIAKIAGIKLCENYYRQYGCNFFSVLPTNMYGPHDNFNLETSHVIPAMIRKFHEAKVNNSDEVVIWGTGKPMREFLFVEDVTDAIEYLIVNVNADAIYSKGISVVNVGTGKDFTILDTAKMIAEVVGFNGKILNDPTKPDGIARKLLDVSLIESFGWKAKTDFKTGIKKSYDWFVANFKN